MFESRTDTQWQSDGAGSSFSSWWRAPCATFTLTWKTQLLLLPEKSLHGLGWSKDKDGTKTLLSSSFFASPPTLTSLCSPTMNLDVTGPVNVS